MKKARKVQEAPITMSALLNEAMTKKGMIDDCFSQFHNYSWGNICLAYAQCDMLKAMGHDVSFGPLATYKKWSTQGRKVLSAPSELKGAWGIVMCQPRPWKSKTEFDSKGNPKQGVTYTYPRRWFFMSQTEEIEGQEQKIEDLPSWDYKVAMSKLGLTQIPFAHHNGNAMGYANGKKEIAVSPLSKDFYGVLFHEIAHQVLGHCKGQDMEDSVELDQTMQEVEAESVAYILSSINKTADETQLAKSRGYIQGWFSRNSIEGLPEKNANNVFTAVNTILTAGSKKTEVQEARKQEQELATAE